jgi:hypothetical protein
MKILQYATYVLGILGTLFLGASSYDVDLVTSSLHLTQATYCVDTANKNTWSCPTCDESVKLVSVVEEMGGRALVGYNPTYNAIFVSYRGSEDIMNWIDNAQLTQVSPYMYMPDVGIEKGFYKVYSYLIDGVLDGMKLTADKYGTTKVMIQGHSLGAIATILAFEIALYEDYDVYSLVTFGSPRIGNNAFVREFNKLDIDSTRVTHYRDIVPHLPEELLEYEHIPNEVWYNEENSHYEVCDDENGEDKYCSNSCAPLHCTSTSDHLYYLNVSMGSQGEC